MLGDQKTSKTFCAYQEGQDSDSPPSVMETQTGLAIRPECIKVAHMGQDGWTAAIIAFQILPSEIFVLVCLIEVSPCSFIQCTHKLLAPFQTLTGSQRL